MSYLNGQSLTLNGSTFNGLKNDFDEILKKTIRNMEQKESEFAEITVKLKVRLEKQTLDFQKINSGEEREVTVPTFEHKVSSVLQIKNEVTGFLGGGYELVWDAIGCEYIMREIPSSQISMFE